MNTAHEAEATIAVSNPDSCPYHQLAAIWQRNRTRLLDCAQAVVGCREAAEDIVQSAFLRLWERRCLGHVREGDRFLFRVVRNMAIDWHRAKLRERRFCVADVDTLGNAGVLTITPEDSVGDARSLAQVLSALSNLPGRMQKVLVMTRLEGLTQREVARQLEVSPTLVNFMLRDGMDQCRQSLGRAH